MIILSLTIKDTCYDIIIGGIKPIQFQKIPMDCYGCNGEDCPLELLEDDEKCEGYGTPLIRLDIQRYSLI